MPPPGGMDGTGTSDAGSRGGGLRVFSPKALSPRSGTKAAM